MPQLLLLAAVGVGAYAGYRWIRGQIVSEARNTRARTAAPGQAPSDRAREAGDLVWDEKAGVYRPRS